MASKKPVLSSYQEAVKPYQDGILKMVELIPKKYSAELSKIVEQIGLDILSSVK